MRSFAIFRLPHASHCTLVAQMEGEPSLLTSPDQLNGQTGFVMAPFQPSSSQPILLIRPDKVEQDPELSPLDCCMQAGECEAFGGSPETYAADFATFHQALEEGRFQKLVLSRCATEPNDGNRKPTELFLRACQLYPRLFIALVSTSQSGTWLTATPEILLEGQQHEWRTIALAGTMRLHDDELQGEGQHLRWSTKNIEEQRYVASYIADTLRQVTSDVREEGPRTVRAANLVHLRSDFTFTLSDDMQVGELLSALHPTPAVCGLPKAEALRFITQHERTPRSYYSGYMGPLDIEHSTHLYVSLRCMQITRERFRLYAGGGLLRDSVEQKEWRETEAKMETMRQCIATRRT
ncbi:MAG: chorismate-binding protein [Prevotella sp.]|nr:chorismate-binding protein [Prevotella sp.]